MGKKLKGVNTKVEAANLKKAAVAEEKNAKKQKEVDRQLDLEWDKGSDARGANKQKELERKRQEQDLKKAEKEKLREEEEGELNKMKLAKSATRKTKSQKDMDRPWEQALLSATKPKNKGIKTQPSSNAAATTITFATSSAAAKNKTSTDEDELATASMLHENRNRMVDDFEARTIEDAIDVLNLGKSSKPEKHPERRAKAAYKAFEEQQLAILKEDYPGLKLSQYKQKLSDMWKKSPLNPMNQEFKAYNEKS